MKLLVLFVLLAVSSLAADLFLANVNIIDVKTGSLLAHRCIHIHGNRIQSISTSARPTRGATVVDGRGRFVIPGLWDMHVRLWDHDAQFPMFVAWGVTGVRDMGSGFDRIAALRKRIASRTLVGPHIETGGPAIDGLAPDDAKRDVVVVRTASEARSAYDHLEQDLHVDFISVSSHLPRDAYFALAERARKWDLAISGDVPDSVSAEEAVSARQTSIERLSGVPLACSREEHKLRSLLIKARERNDEAALASYSGQVWETYDSEKANALFDRMAKFQCYQTPSLVWLRRSAYLDAEESTHSPLLKYVPAAMRKQWPDPREKRKDIPDEVLDIAERQYGRGAYIVDQMHRFHAPVMTGTGAGDPYAFPGYDLHRELQLLVEAGLTPLDALRAATIAPAEYMDAADSLGSIAPGKSADLVLLEADPLKDIRNTRKIAGVVLDGRYLTKAALDSLILHARQ